MSNNTPSFSNFFDLYDQPVAFDIDTSMLNQKLRSLQKQYHPDNMSGSNTAQSQQNSAVINHAYEILLNPDSRATYLLELSNQELNSDKSISDLDFLDDAMDLRVALEDAESNQDIDTIQSLKTSVDTRIDDYSDRFKSAYVDQDWNSAIDATQKLKFLVKLKRDINTAIDTSQQGHDNDDDLYL